MELSERKKRILTAVVESYIATAEPVGSKALAQQIGCSSATIRNEMSELTAMAARTADTLDSALLEANGISGCEELSVFCRDRIFAAMSELRICVDEMETLTSAKYWPYPSYGEMLFSVR